MRAPLHAIDSFVHSNKQRSSCMPCALNLQNDPNRSHVRKNSHQGTTMFGKRTNSGSYPENQSRSGSRHVCPQGLTSASLCMHQRQCWTARHASVLGGAAGAHPPRGQFPLASGGPNGVAWWAAQPHIYTIAKHGTEYGKPIRTRFGSMHKVHT